MRTEDKHIDAENPGRPLVSVIIVTYNQQDTISEAVESVLGQVADFRFEILLSDDCSSDGTYEICKGYEERYPDVVRVHRNERNLGLLKNYYDAIFRAGGEYVADCAGDDFWTDRLKLQKQVDVMRNNPGVTLVHTAWKTYDATTGMMETWDPGLKREKILKPMTEKGGLVLPILRRDAPAIINLCTAMYRRDAICEEYAKNPDLFIGKEFTCEDIQLETVMSLRGKIAYIPDFTLAYRRGHKSMSSEESYAKNFRFNFGTLRLNRRLQLKFGIDDEALREYHSRQIRYLYAQLFRMPHDTSRICEFEKFVDDMIWDSDWKTRIYKHIMKFRWLHGRLLKILVKGSLA